MVVKFHFIFDVSRQMNKFEKKRLKNITYTDDQILN